MADAGRGILAGLADCRRRKYKEVRDAANIIKRKEQHVTQSLLAQVGDAVLHWTLKRVNHVLCFLRNLKEAKQKNPKKTLWNEKEAETPHKVAIKHHLKRREEKTVNYCATVLCYLFFKPEYQSLADHPEFHCTLSKLIFYAGRLGELFDQTVSMSL